MMQDSKKWRVVGLSNGDDVYAYVVHIGPFANESDAHAAVEAHNAQGEPVVWQIGSSLHTDHTEKAARTTAALLGLPKEIVRPLYAAPPPAPADPIAVVERLKAVEAERDRLTEKKSWDSTVAEEFYHVFAAIQRIWDIEVLHPQKLLPAMRSIKAERDAALARVKALEAGLRPFATVATHWCAEAYMRDDVECLIAWASDVSARLITSMATQLPRIRFEAFLTAARLLAQPAAPEGDAT